MIQLKNPTINGCIIRAIAEEFSAKHHFCLETFGDHSCIFMTTSSSSILINVICLLIFSSFLWRDSHGATARALTPGDNLNSSTSFVSANGKFNIGFHVFDHNSNYSYLVVKLPASHNYAWIANRNKPVFHPLGFHT